MGFWSARIRFENHIYVIQIILPRRSIPKDHRIKNLRIWVSHFLFSKGSNMRQSPWLLVATIIVSRYLYIMLQHLPRWIWVSLTVSWVTCLPLCALVEFAAQFRQKCLLQTNKWIPTFDYQHLHTNSWAQTVEYQQINTDISIPTAEHKHLSTNKWIPTTEYQHLNTNRWIQFSDRQQLHFITFCLAHTSSPPLLCDHINLLPSGQGSKCIGCLELLNHGHAVLAHGSKANESNYLTEMNWMNSWLSAFAHKCIVILGQMNLKQALETGTKHQHQSTNIWTPTFQLRPPTVAHIISFSIAQPQNTVQYQQLSTNIWIAGF